MISKIILNGIEGLAQYIALSVIGPILILMIREFQLISMLETDELFRRTVAVDKKTIMSEISTASLMILLTS